MKRIVKGWAWVYSDTALIAGLYKQTRLGMLVMGLTTKGKSIPCTITYDDGRPAKKRKK